MAQAGRWVTAIGIALGVLAACVGLADVLLPWDTATNVLTGGTAGVVVGAVIAVWADSEINRDRPDAPQPGERHEPEPASARQRVSGGAGVQVTPSGRNKIGNITVTVNPPPAPPPPNPNSDGTVVPPKN